MDQTATKKRGWTRPEEVEIATMRWCGVKVAVIAHRVRRSVACVRNKLSTLGLVVSPSSRPHTYPRGELTRRVRQLFARGKCVRDAAEILGVEASCVSRIRKALGIPPATKSAAAFRAWSWRRKVVPSKVAELVASGWSRTRIAEYFDCSVRYVGRVKKKLRETT